MWRLGASERRLLVVLCACVSPIAYQDHSDDASCVSKNVASFVARLPFSSHRVRPSSPHTPRVQRPLIRAMLPVSSCFPTFINSLARLSLDRHYTRVPDCPKHNAQRGSNGTKKVTTTKLCVSDKKSRIRPPITPPNIGLLSSFPDTAYCCSD